MKKIPAIFTALALAGTSIAIPQAASAQTISYADLYTPEDSPYGALNASPSRSMAAVFGGLPSDRSLYSFEITWGNSPYPVTLSATGSIYFDNYVYVALEP
ncbi:hypothetical protein [Corynebacterium callunae]|uniref:Uncharacterized protein n=1 Tax=Corynebacterium callunae DSM 20147 TaxID=1121353 RepID=M1UGB2_9CORY|nr:hypothetical protein [Corynebacterium callunae]AGG67305.1 hypothetical protein H924_09335 [Corynebacterium callunae DSM 20147]